MNLGFLIHEDFWYMVLILDFTGSNVAIPSFVYKNLARSKKSHNIYAIT